MGVNSARRSRGETWRLLDKAALTVATVVAIEDVVVDAATGGPEAASLDEAAIVREAEVLVAPPPLRSEAAAFLIHGGFKQASITRKDNSH